MLQRSAEGGMKVKRRNFFSTLLGGALGLVGMKGARAEERVTDRLRRRLEEHQRLASIDRVQFTSWRKPEPEPEPIDADSIPCVRIPSPIQLPEIPPEVFEAQQKWKKEHGL